MSHFDRLSALLDGIAPRMTVLPAATALCSTLPASPQPLLYLHLLLEGELNVLLDGQSTLLHGPAIMVCQGRQAHELQAADAQVFGQLLCAQALLEGPGAALFLSQFAQPLFLSLQDADPVLQQAMALIAVELAQPRCGRHALLARAGDILFIGLLRHLVANPAHDSGLFNALGDAPIARALVAMHSQPQQDWSLERLADTAGLSRTAFAVRFRERMNIPPGKYLGHLRLAIARRVVDSGAGLKRAAHESGYRNVAALSRALSRAH